MKIRVANASKGHLCYIRKLGTIFDFGMKHYLNPQCYFMGAYFLEFVLTRLIFQDRGFFRNLFKVTESKEIRPVFFNLNLFSVFTFLYVYIWSSRVVRKYLCWLDIYEWGPLKIFEARLRSLGLIGTIFGVSAVFSWGSHVGSEGLLWEWWTQLSYFVTYWFDWRSLLFTEVSWVSLGLTEDYSDAMTSLRTNWGNYMFYT